MSDTYRKTNVDNTNLEREGFRQHVLEPHPTKCVASEMNLALSPKMDVLVEIASPKEVAKLEELPPREVRQQEPEKVLRLQNPKRRRTIFLDELPPADVPFLEQSTPKKAAVFKKLLSKNAASVEEPFAVRHEPAVESTPRTSAVFRRLRTRTASTSENTTPENVAPPEEPQPENPTTFEGTPPKPIATLKKLALKVMSAVRKVVDHAQSGKSGDDKEVVDDCRLEPVIPEAKMSAICVETKVEVKQDEEEETNRNTSDEHLGSATARDLGPPSEVSRGEGAPDGGEIANESEILKRNVENENGNPAMARADPQRAAASGCGNPACATDKKEEGKEEVAEKAEDTDSSSSLEDGEIRDDPSGVPSDHESCDSWPENYIYPATSSVADTRILARAPGGSRGASFPSEQFYADLVDRMMNVRLSSAARPDQRPHSIPPAGNSQIDDSHRYEYSSWVERKVPKAKTVKPSDIYFRRAGAGYGLFVRSELCVLILSDVLYLYYLMLHWLTSSSVLSLPRRRHE
ncbi:unnamed protein product [Heligmosomoides polygyrus]|uniref:Pecanex-like protein n=1 Tax=Heligmosomoides polygyrus TaxID=6339 RepID=A0A3P7ZTE4_HELPZ|nr:unnamed protein product [Heligmosomoides polygyrus]